MSTKERVFEPEYRISRTKPQEKKGRLVFKSGLNFYGTDKYPRFSGITDTQAKVLEWLWRENFGGRIASAPICIRHAKPEPYRRWSERRGHHQEDSYLRVIVWVQLENEKDERQVVFYYVKTQAWNKTGQYSGYHVYGEDVRIMWAK